MTIAERNIKLNQLITCLKCKSTVGGICDSCQAQYQVGTFNDIVENLEEISRILECARWIPVSERLPDPQENGDKDYSDWLQVTIDIGRNGDSDVYVCEAYYCFSESKWYTKRFVVGVVTAWRPLPEPCKV
jgi:hypothetical protein